MKSTLYVAVILVSVLAVGEVRGQTELLTQRGARQLYVDSTRCVI